MPAADGVAGDHGDNRLRQTADFLLQVQHIETRHSIAADVAGMSADLLITAGAKGLITFAG